jgi:hypothetical protein
LLNIIWEAKKYYFNEQIKNSKNKMKTIWGITRSLNGIRTESDDVRQLNNDGNTNHA